MELRTRGARLAFLFVAAWPIAAAAQAPRPTEPTSIVVDPAPEPIPSLKYRLFPMATELAPGNAAPIYLRARYQISDDLWSRIETNGLKWRELPIEKFPAAEARDFLRPFARTLEQVAFGARRRSCDWDYTLPEQRTDRIDVALPDAQAMRQVIRLIDFQARVEIADRQFDRAIRSMETGMALSRHVAEGPFYINGLIGLAGDYVMLNRCEELIARPGSPNLYWALTALPRPLVDFRRMHEIEETLCEDMIPELVEARSDRPRTPAEWSALLARLHARMIAWCRTMIPIQSRPGKPDDPSAWLNDFSTWDLNRLRAEMLPAAREYLKSKSGAGAMSDDQRIAVYLAGRHRELWDEVYRESYLPPRTAIERLADVGDRLRKASRPGPLAFFVAMIPSVRDVSASSLRFERRLDALRAIEALRMHAAAHGGQLPKALGEVKVVPVPDDPWTGRPFRYRLDGDAAVLEAEPIAIHRGTLAYRITIRR